MPVAFKGAHCSLPTDNEIQENSAQLKDVDFSFSLKLKFKTLAIGLQWKKHEMGESTAAALRGNFNIQIF